MVNINKIITACMLYYSSANTTFETKIEDAKTHQIFDESYIKYVDTSSCVRRIMLSGYIAASMIKDNEYKNLFKSVLKNDDKFEFSYISRLQELADQLLYGMGVISNILQYMSVEWNMLFRIHQGKYDFTYVDIIRLQRHIRSEDKFVNTVVLMGPTDVELVTYIHDMLKQYREECIRNDNIVIRNIRMLHVKDKDTEAYALADRFNNGPRRNKVTINVKDLKDELVINARDWDGSKIDLDIDSNGGSVHVIRPLSDLPTLHCSFRGTYENISLDGNIEAYLIKMVADRIHIKNCRNNASSILVNELFIEDGMHANKFVLAHMNCNMLKVENSILYWDMICMPIDIDSKSLHDANLHIHTTAVGGIDSMKDIMKCNAEITYS
ncbi:hypothetical protein [Candidatus Cytomitobacter primus]|uniref:Uncharacterized protein n=1 Tax=Candidatus Cytomitobacter primus TaxID=2066024 RepID=A0A5C0UGH8_9PROT|nr:hypothetical protein [Candidatus Cytomitobacter primus]QEK38663.1 hypothetical protein FZC34_01950 [Candidatus Cytomitobacter primus]